MQRSTTGWDLRRDIPSPVDNGYWGSAISSPSMHRSRAQTKNNFIAFITMIEQLSWQQHGIYVSLILDGIK